MNPWWQKVRDPRGWYTTGVLAALAAVLRLPNLGWPRAFVFDETYYAKDAYSLLNFGNERAFVDGVNERILAGNFDVFDKTAAFVVHPPLGKWMIAAGEAVFGMDPFGWRISAALIGIVMVAMVHRIALRLFMNTWIAALAGLFMAIDGMAIVLSRTALLDQFLTFWLLLTLYALVRDRDHYRHTLQLLAYEQPVAPLRWARPWRLLAIVAISCAFATKWSALWFGFGFGLLALWWDARERETHPEVDPRSWLRDLGWIGIAIVLGSLTYASTWWGWFASDDAYDRNWSPNALTSWIEYHQNALGFHTGLTTAHPYEALPFWWPLQWRPTSFWYESFANGDAGCAVEKCSAEVLALGNPLLWWGASLAVIGVLIAAVVSRRERGRLQALVAPLIGIASGWLPWLYFYERTTFTFYSIVFAPFMFMVLAFALVSLATRVVVQDGEEFSVAVETRHPMRFPLVVGFVIAAVIASAFFYPVWVGSVIPYDAWQLRMWFPSWI